MRGKKRERERESEKEKEKKGREMFFASYESDETPDLPTNNDVRLPFRTFDKPLFLLLLSSTLFTISLDHDSCKKAHSRQLTRRLKCVVACERGEPISTLLRLK